ncbi:MAG: CPBP family intramembrane metalloprotease [Marinilabiliales bacterium]|nr:CPBP family intramembrane metalloprotease [Marinilabiliales bacterium]
MKFLRHSTPLTQLFFTLIFILLGGVALSLAGMFGYWIFSGISPVQLATNLTQLDKPENVAIMKVLQLLQSVGMFVLPPLALAFFSDDQPLARLQMDQKPGWRYFLLVVALIVFGGPFIEWLTLVNQHLSLPTWLNGVEQWMRSSEDQAEEITKALLSVNSLWGLSQNLFIVAVIPALGEELLFRGLLQQLFKKMMHNSHVAIWFTAILFSALHLQFYGFLPRMLLGVLFGYLLEWTGNLWLPILAHFINNGWGIVYFYVTGEGLDVDYSKESIFENEQFFYGLLSAMALLLILHYFWKHRIRLTAPIAESGNEGVGLPEL